MIHKSQSIGLVNFNLYEDGGNNWSIELVGTESFDLEDKDWCCDEIFDFGTREIPLSWNEILDEMMQIIKTYLEQGAYLHILKNYQGVGIGFSDRDIEILFTK